MGGDLEKDLGVIKTEAASKPWGSLRAPKEGIGAEECQIKYQAPGRSLRLLTPAAEVERVGRRETGSGYFEREASTLTNATEKPCEMKTKKKGPLDLATWRP